MMAMMAMKAHLQLYAGNLQTLLSKIVNNVTAGVPVPSSIIQI